MLNIKEKLIQFPEAISLAKLFIKAGGEARFIGGVVRDIIVGREAADIDLATNLLPDKVEEILKKNQFQFLSIGKVFGTITAIVNHHKIEITTLRQDIHCDGRRAQVSFSKDWQEDARRRDFTINAMSCDIDGNIYDYFDGFTDLQQKIVRFIGNPEERIIEDYLRILRFFRFSAYFAENLDQVGLKACSKYADKFSSISINRIRAELSKIFIAPRAIEILTLMQQHKILPCKVYAITILKNLDKLKALFSLPPSELSSLAALLRGFKQPNAIISNSAFTRNEKYLLEQLVFSNLKKFDLEALRNYWRQYKHDFQEVILINLAVDYAQLNDELIKNLQRLFRKKIKLLPISGEDLADIGIKPGKEMGELLDLAESLWYKNEFNITKDELIFYIKSR